MIQTIRSLALFPVLFLCAAITIVPGGHAATHPDLSGTWKQSNDGSTPKRKGEVTLHIEHRDPALSVETTIARASGPPRHALQRYTTDGKVSVSTGADGDEFHTAVTWQGDSLVFAVEEHEDGKILVSKEIWTLTSGGELKRVRERPDRATHRPSCTCASPRSLLK